MSGFWIGKNPLRNRNRFHWSVNRHDLISKGAVVCQKPEEFNELAICVVAGQQYLWFHERENWILLGKITIIKRAKNSATSIRGFYIQEISTNKIPQLPRHLVSEPNLSHRLDDEIESIARSLSRVVPVKCQLSMDSNKYVVRFTNSSDELCDERSILKTFEILDILRQPMVKGIPLMNSKNPEELLTWDPYSDIDYRELQLLKPYIERRTPYIHVRLSLPTTAKELASAPTNYETVFVEHDRNLCPLATGNGQSHDACWRVGFPDDISEPSFHELNKRGLFDYEIVNLVTGGVYLETGRYELNAELLPEPTTREGTVFRESNALAHMLGMKSISEGTFLKMEQEQLICDIGKDRGGPGIKLTAYSDLTGEEVYYWLVLTMDPDLEIDTGLKVIKQRIQEIVSGYFNNDAKPEERVQNYDKLITDARQLLRELHIGYLEERLQEKDASSEDLKILIHFRREEADGQNSTEVADILYDLAKLYLKENEVRYALESIDESIRIYQEQLKNWKAEWIKKELSKAKRLRTRIANLKE